MQLQPANIRALRVGGGELVRTEDGLRLLNPPGAGRRYTNAQIDDYAGRTRAGFLWHPPLRLSVQARFSHAFPQLAGTAGFGFWNDPFLMTELRPPTLPRALWFFYASPPSDMALALDTPGYGWKAACIDALHVRSVAALPLLALTVPMMRSSRVRRRLWPFFQRNFSIAEAGLELAMQDWHLYQIDWQEDQAVFRVDGCTVLATTQSPAGPLGMVIWLDNQYMVVRPDGTLRNGLVARNGLQWLEVSDVVCET